MGHSYARAARRPDRGSGWSEQRNHGRTRSRGQVSGPGIVADIEARGGQPAGKLVQIGEAAGFGQFIVRSGAPFDGHAFAEPARDFAETLHGPALFAAPGKRMDHRMAAAAGRARDARNAVGGAGRDAPHLVQIEVGGMPSGAVARQGREKVARQRQRGHRLAKLGPAGPIPGNDGIETTQGFEQSRVRFTQFQQIQSGGSDGTRARSHAASQGDVGLRRPDFRGAQAFDGGKGDDEIADGARPDDQPLQEPSIASIVRLGEGKTVPTLSSRVMVCSTQLESGRLRKRMRSRNTRVCLLMKNRRLLRTYWRCSTLKSLRNSSNASRRASTLAL